MPPALATELLPAPADVRSYQEHGWWLAPVLFPDAEIELLREGVAEHQAGRRDAELPPIPGMDDWAPGDPRPLRINDYVTLTNTKLRRLTNNPLIGATAALLAGTLGIRLWQSGILHKEPNAQATDTRIGWHTDKAYWRSCSSTRMLTAWVALQDVYESMGALTVLDRSHRWPGAKAAAMRMEKSFSGRTAEAVERRLAAIEVDIVPVPMRMRKGQVSFHHCLTMHGSGPNLSDRTRIALSAHLQDVDNRFRQVPTEDGGLEGHKNDWICRRTADGDPDYTDPTVFPTLWPTAGDTATNDRTDG